jgi:hypothetical protein
MKQTSLVAAVLLVGATTIFAACSSSSSSPAAPADAGKPAGTANIGQACPNGASDCLTGLQCDTSDPNGQCYKECTASTDSECGDTTKFACNYEGHCYVKCNSTTDCARASEGFVCKDDQPPRNVKFCDGPH